MSPNGLSAKGILPLVRPMGCRRGALSDWAAGAAMTGRSEERAGARANPGSECEAAPPPARPLLVSGPGEEGARGKVGERAGGGVSGQG